MPRGSRGPGRFKPTARGLFEGLIVDILFLLVPVSVALALAVMGLLAWAVGAGQFEDMESEGQRIFEAPEAVAAVAATEEAATSDGS